MFADGGALRPADALTRMEMARALMLAARVPQFLPDRPSFSDLAEGGSDALIAESLRREGVMGAGVAAFGPAAQVTRLEQAVALVRAIRLDAAARALANTDVRAGGQVLVDNNQIPGPWRGYVQIAIDRELMQALPAELRQVGPGQFQAIPGPRFEPARAVKRAEFLDPALKVISILFGE
jgi:hypothetical protein